MGGSNSNAVWSLFRAKNTANANSWLSNIDKCRTYVIFPSGITKRLRTSDNCGTFAYRYFSKCMGAGAGLPIGLWNAPVTLVSKGTKRFNSELIMQGIYS